MITLVSGNIQNPSGLAQPNGSIGFQLNIDATIIAAPYGIIPAELEVVFQFDATGNLIQPCQIYSNLELNPQNSIGLGTLYLVTFYDQNGARLNKSPMLWQFPSVAGSTVNISQMTAFSSVGGNVIYYPTSITIPTPGPTTLGGVFSNAGSPNQFVVGIATNGTLILAQPSFANISGTISPSQFPSFGATTFTGLITAEGGINVGEVSAGGQIGLVGGTSGQATITAPAVAGTITNPILMSNSLTLAATCILTAPGGITIAGTTITAQSGTGGTVAMTASPTFTGTIIAAALTASGTIRANLFQGPQQDVVQVISGATGAATFPGTTVITYGAGAAVVTLALPTAGAFGTGNDGAQLLIFSTTAESHTVTVANSGHFLVTNNTGAKHIATFSDANDFIQATAYNGYWLVTAYSSGVSWS